MVGDRFEMVSEWMGSGNINEFLKANPDANRLGLVGFLFEVLLSRSFDDHFHSWGTSVRGWSICMTRE